MVALHLGQRVVPIEYLLDCQSGIVGAMPRVPDDLLDGVAFLYQTVEQATLNERIGGTGFLVSRFAPLASEVLGQPVRIPFLVSNRHVVWNAGACIPRFNRRDGSGKIIEFDAHQWVPHPNGDDVAAVCLFGLINRVEDKISSAKFDELITERIAKKYDIGIGDDVCMIGRFINHQGRGSIRPAVRFGNISMMPEPIYNNALNHDQISYAVEMRSRTGFSGAPVIAYRIPGTALTQVPGGGEGGWGVLGINWGHIIDEKGENTWLNGVVPAWKISELMEVPELKKKFDEADAMAASLPRGAAAEPSVAVEDVPPPTTDENPRHKEDFNSLLDAAVKGPQSDDQT